MALSASPDTAFSLWYCGQGRAEIRQENLPSPAAAEVRVKTLFSALSRGTESLVFAGRIPESEYKRMRAPVMAGNFPFPVKYGYASVGQVQDGSAALYGRNVFALHPHQTAFNIPVGSAIVLPDQVPPHRAVLAANMETAINGIWDAAPGPADRIAVIGAGVVGTLVAYLCGQLPGAEVTLVDINPARAELAAALGVGFAEPAKAAAQCDLVVHASGSPDGLVTALELAGDEATVLEMSWYGDQPVTVPLGGPFHSRRLRLISSQVGSISPSHRPRWSYNRRLSAALGLLADARLEALLAPPIAFHDLPKLLPEILAAGSTTLCQPIVYP